MRKFTKLLMFFALCLWGTQGNAQNVTIGPDNGNLIVGQAGGNTDDSGIKRGLYSMWRHEQLALTMTTSDIANLTSAGELFDPSCAIGKYNGKLILAAGQTQTFVVVSLPKGYRITGYRLVLQADLLGQNVRGPHASQDFNICYSEGTTDQCTDNKGAMAFYETPGWSSGCPYPGRTNNTHSLQLDCPDALATASAGTDTQIDPIDDAEKEFVIARTSDDMTNQLHFFFARSCSQYGLSINSFEIFFTAEGSFDADVAPISAGVATDYVQTPFTTSKMDVGQMKLTNNIYNYDYTNVRDLKGYLHIYQDNTCAGGYPEEVDGGQKNIYPLDLNGQGAIAYGNDIFFIEPPTTIKTTSGWKQPIGFRIVGATFEYKYGDAIAASSIDIANGLYIQGRGPNDGNNTTRYLNSSLDFVTVNNQNNRPIWQLDEFGNIWTGTDTDRQYLACYGSSEDERIISLSSAATGAEAKWNLKIDDDNHLYYTDSQGHKFVLNIQRRQEGGAYHNRGYVTVGATNYLATANKLSGTHSVDIPGFTPGSYTLKIYDKTGNALATDPITVSSKSDEGTYTLEGLNNDAVKFEISDLAEGTQALVHVSLELQALNPYINSMDITCHDTPDLFQLTQTFTANDFRVSGGKFIFYIPEEYYEELMTITFDKLYSNYGDNTYYTGTPDQKDGNARYSFVTSQYFMSNPDLYNTDPDASYTTKISTSTAGNIRFKFNNAEDLTPGSTQDYLQEYQFDYDDYIGSDDPDGGVDSEGNPKKGAYISCQLKASDGEMKEGTFYVFTADETRYNIAPSTEWEHRAYAFYRMDVVLEAKTYEPELTWTKVYDKTCYYSGEEDNFPDTDLDTPQGSASTNPMFGLKVTTTEANNGQMGYLTYNSIIQAINTAVSSGNDVDVPKNKNQILYIDCSELNALQVSSTTTGTGSEAQTTTIDMSTLKTGLADNALVFMPKNSTSTLDNVAYLLSGAFYAGKDIVLTDRKPFYSPYEIQVDASNKAIYTRVETLSDKKDVLATVMLPYTLNVSNGVHTNADNTTISLWEMSTSDLSTQNTHDYYGVSYFQKVGGTSTSANVPYLVNMDKQGTQGSDYSFIASQTGGKIFATKTGMTQRTVTSSGYNEGVYKYLYIGTPVTGVAVDVPGSSVSLTPEGSYAGHIYDRAESNAVFYFADNKFLNLYTLKGTKQFLYMYPFRSVYTFEGSFPSVNSLYGLEVSFDDPGNLDAIRDITKAYVPDLAVRSGKGFIEMTSAKDQTVNVFSLNGTSYSRVNMNAGDRKTVTLPAGVYVVNNVKIIVK